MKFKGRLYGLHTLAPVRFTLSKYPIAQATSMSPTLTCLHKFLSIKQTQTCSAYRDEMFIYVFIPGIIYIRLGKIVTKVGKDLSST